MIPSVIARQIQRGVKDFLLTTFPITNPFFAGTLEKLLATPGHVVPRAISLREAAVRASG